MSSKLSDRIASYQEQSDYKLLNRVPVVICVNGRSFSKTTSLLDKPYSAAFSECILNTMLRLCSDIEGAIFGYQYNDEIVILARNDQAQDTLPWFDNKVQKIASIASSIASVHFHNCASAINLQLMGELTFTAQVFTVPNIMEAINTIICKQQQNFYTSMQFACFYELINRFDKGSIKEMISGLSNDEKKDLLRQECNVEFNDYPMTFRRGAACYRVPKVGPDGTIKNKWIVNQDVPIFTSDTSFLGNVLKNNGVDIFRKESL